MAATSLAGMRASRAHYSTTEQMLVGAIKEQQQQQQASASRSRSRRAAKAGVEGSYATTEQEMRDKPGPAAVPQVKPHRRRATRAQKQAVQDLDDFDPSASSRDKLVQLPVLVPPGRSKSVLDDAPDARVGIAAPSPARFRSQSVDPTPTTMDPRHTTMVWSPPHPTQLLDKRTDLRTMFANGALSSVTIFDGVPETIARLPCGRHTEA